ncbi:MAG: PEP-CTERM sorting domain-containing protein [Sulfuriferula sp.]
MITKNAVGSNLLSGGATAANKIRLITDEALHNGREWLAADVLGQDKCAIPCTNDNFVALDANSGFFIPGSSSHVGDRTKGESPPGKQKQQDDRKAGTAPKPGPTVSGNAPYGSYAPAGGTNDVPSGSNSDPNAGPDTNAAPGQAPSFPVKQPQSTPSTDHDPIAGNPAGPFIPLNAPVLLAQPLDGSLPFVAGGTATHPVPEPAVFGLVAIGLLGMAWLRKKPD